MEELKAKVESVERRLHDVEGKTLLTDGRVERLEAEERRTRKRLHDIESDRHALSLATTAVVQLANRVKAALDDVDSLAEEAASRAIEKAKEERQKTWRGRVFLWTAVVTAVAAVLALLLQQFHVTG